MDDSAKGIYEFLWSEFADWYVELAKPRLRSDDREHVQYILWHVLETSMRLLHPIMPFITEEIWQALPHEGDSIMIAPFPVADESLIDDEAEARMATVMEAVRLIRNLRAEVGLPMGTWVYAIIITDRVNLRQTFEEANDAVKRLCKLTDLTLTHTQPTLGSGGYVVSHGTGFDAYLLLDRKSVVVEVEGPAQAKISQAQMDQFIEKMVTRIDSDLTSIEKELARVTGKLSNEQFVSKAPAQIVEKERRVKTELEDKKSKLEEQKKALAG
jgi:valyl-tRNA synthetase